MNAPRNLRAAHPTRLAQDLQTLQDRISLQRRQTLRWLSAGIFAAGSPLALSACGGDDNSDGSDSASPTPSPSPSPSPSPAPSTDTSTCSAIPEETAGPYPGDGTNTANGSVVNVLTQSGVLRSDIRSSFGTLSGTAGGVPLTVALKLVNSANSCANLTGYAVYLWHCTREGEYSLYAATLGNQNYLRGVQVSDSSGLVSFTTIFPGCYSGRWPHIHFEVYQSLALATSGNNDVRTSQLALPQAVCSTVYNGDSAYSASVRNLAQISLASDNVFGNDSAATQIATVTGSLSEGYLATLTVGVGV
jgi:protocatechuate 3,4-dioxygenase beta subunit